MTEKLKPCPWCKDTKELQVLDDNELNIRCGNGLDPRYAVNCPMCGCNGPSATTPTEAIAKWNRRAE